MNIRKSLLEIHSAVFLFGLAGLFGKLISLSSIIIVMGRVFFASITLFFLLTFFKLSFRISEKKDYMLLGALGILISFHWITFFQSIKISTVAIGLLSYSSFPIFTAFLEPILLREKFDLKILFISMLTFIGVFIMIPQFKITNKFTQGILWGLASGLSFSVLSITNRKLIQKYSSLTIAFYQDLLATFVLFPFYILLKPKISLNELLLLIILGVFCTALSHSLFIKSMKRLKARTASIISTLEPVYGIILAMIFLKEIPNVRTALGGLLIISSVLLVSVKSNRL